MVVSAMRIRLFLLYWISHTTRCWEGQSIPFHFEVSRRSKCTKSIVDKSIAVIVQLLLTITLNKVFCEVARWAFRQI